MRFMPKGGFQDDLPREFWKGRVPFMMFRVLDGAVSPPRGAFPTYHTTPHPTPFQPSNFGGRERT